MIQLFYICTQLACYDVSVQEEYKDKCKVFFSKDEVVQVVCEEKRTIAICYCQSETLFESVIIKNWSEKNIGRVEMEVNSIRNKVFVPFQF